MSDKDSDHMLLELQEARAEIDRLRELLRWRVFKEEKPNNFGCYLICDSDGCDIYIGHWRVDKTWSHGVSLMYWRPIGPLPHSNMPVFSKESVAMYECKCGCMKNSNESCLNCGQLPRGE